MVEELLLQQNYQRVIYLGDGRGDHCPCTRLGPSDHILARHSYPDGSPCALLRLLTGQGAQAQACLQFLSAHNEEVTVHPESSSKAGNPKPLSAPSETVPGELSTSRTAGSSSPPVSMPRSVAAEQSHQQHHSGLYAQQQQQQPDANQVDAARCQDESGNGSEEDMGLPPPPPRAWQPSTVQHTSPQEASEVPHTVQAYGGSSTTDATAVGCEEDDAPSLLKIHAATYSWNCSADAASALRCLLQQMVTKGDS